MTSPKLGLLPAGNDDRFALLAALVNRPGFCGGSNSSTDCGFSEGAEFVCEPHREWLSELAR
ncbi:hypothetical protein, partial [Paraburkholderia sp. UYCP14C]|uniref:hypothetical protein n=1 Tax=Paraburkholderia sp. UYCP14C TaxID=2511130 RepID=UPI001B7D4DDF